MSARISTFDVLTGKVPFAAARVETNVPRLSVVPATIDLMAFERELMATSGRHYRLRDASPLMLAAEDPDKTTTYILIDCPPSLNLLTVNALAAADAVLVPLQCEFFALEGLAQLLSTVEEIRVRLNPKLLIHGVVLTMYDQRTSWPTRWSTTCGACSATRSTPPSSRAMCAWPSRRRMGSRCFSTIIDAPAAKPISGSLPR